MSKSRMWLWSVRRKTILSILAGGTVMQLGLGGCDPSVREALLSGLQTSFVALTTTFINAFFLALTNVDLPTTNPTVQTVFENLRSIYA